MVGRVFTRALEAILLLLLFSILDAYHLGTMPRSTPLMLFNRGRGGQMPIYAGKHHSVFSSSTISTNVIASSRNGIESDEKSLAEKLRVGVYFSLWYAFNIAYNIYNKRALNMAPALTYSIGFLQLFVGLIYVVPLWLCGLRAKPEITGDQIRSLIPVTICHALTHLGAIVSLGAGAVSFTHIVKAAEPAVSAFLSAIFTKSFLPLPVYLSLLPVMGGVALASLGELSFSMIAFVAAMISNVASASRGIVGKGVLKSPPGKNMNAQNLYAVMTILSAAMCLPVALAIEGKVLVPTIQAMIAGGVHVTFAFQTFMSALTYYLYNEVAFLALDSVAPVTHALGNTIKRVVIILTSVVVFGTTLTTRGAIGSTIAIVGVLLYSLAKDYFN